MRIISTVIIMCFFGCKGQSDKNTIVFNINESTFSIEGINSGENAENPIKDYSVKISKNKIDIKPMFLESDDLDGKTLKIIKGDFDYAEIKYTYDGIFYGEEKLPILIGHPQDTLIKIKIKNRQLIIPSFKKNKYDKTMMESAYLINKNHFSSIISNSDRYGGTSSPDYKNALFFLSKKPKEFKNLEELLTEINYTKLNIKLITQSSKNVTEINFEKNYNIEIQKEDDKMFQTQMLEKKPYNKNFYAEDSVMINLKSINYKVLALENIDQKNNKGGWHFGLPIIIISDSLGKRNKTFQNNNLVYKFNNNCPAEGFDGLVAKDNYFTIQQISCMDFLYVNSYITFKIDEFTGQILLHKYSEEYTDRNNPDKKIPTKIWSSKNFGVKNFENVTEEFLKNLQKK